MLDDLVQTVLASSKYRAVSADLIRRLGARELETRRNLKEAVKATKNALHQVTGAYLNSRPRYDDWRKTLTAARQEGEPAFRDACFRLMEQHVSTRERLPFLPEFYQTALADVSPVRSVLDVACGFNPLAIPWMPLAPGASYWACDIYEDLRGFLDEFFVLAGVTGQAEARDVLTAAPQQEAEVALVLKLLPLLDQWDKSASRRLLQTLPAKHLLVSFPTRSLGGRGKGMQENYEARFGEIAQGEAWEVRRFLFPTELCFRVTKP